MEKLRFGNNRTEKETKESFCLPLRLFGDFGVQIIHI
jgi:hypothetical protein